MNVFFTDEVTREKRDKQADRQTEMDFKVLSTRDRERRERQTDRQRQRETETEKQRDRETQRESDVETETVSVKLGPCRSYQSDTRVN